MIEPDPPSGPARAPASVPIIRRYTALGVLWALLTVTLPATTPVEELLEQAASRLAADPADARRLALAAWESAEQQRLAEPRARALYLLGDAALAANDHFEAIQRLRDAQKAFEAIGDRRQSARCQRRLGDTHYFISNYDSAMALYLSALRTYRQLASEVDDRSLRLAAAHLLATIGNVCRATSARPQAADYYHQALTIYETESFPLGIAGSRANLASVHQDAGQYDLALAENLAGLSVARTLDDTYPLSILLTNAGAASLELGNLEEARGFLDQSMEICRAQDRRRGILANLIRLGQLESRLRNHQKAIEALREAVELARELNDRQEQAEALVQLAESLSAARLPFAALGAYKAGAALRAELVNEARTKRIQELRLIYETERREQELSVMRTEAAAQTRLNRWLGVVAALLGVVVITLFSLFRLRARSTTALAAKNAELERVCQRVATLSLTDDLTGLANRRCIRERIGAEHARSLRTGRTYALILADVDHFKRCNDTLGHDAGDRVLQTLAQLLAGAIRAQDLVGRWGGEEFMFLLPDTNLAGAMALATKIRLAVEEQRIEVPGAESAISLTLGVTVSRPGEGAGEVMLRADEALYAGKRTGRNRVTALETTADQPAEPGPGPSGPAGGPDSADAPPAPPASNRS